MDRFFDAIIQGAGFTIGVLAIIGILQFIGAILK